MRISGRSSFQPALELKSRKRRNGGRVHRTKAPTALEEELREVFELLLQTPQIGILAPTRKRKFMRRIFLPRTRYHIYYRNTAPGIEILALWHASRLPRRGL